MHKITIYGIPNCDIIKKAMKWLDTHQVKYVFHDYKTKGISTSTLEKWCSLAGWENIFNKRSTTWREFATANGVSVSNQSEAIEVMKSQNSIIKRPIIEFEKQLIIGFDEKKYSSVFINNKTTSSKK